MLATIRKRAREAHKHIILAEGNDERVVIAAARARKERLARITLLGDVDKILVEAHHTKTSLSGISLLDTGHKHTIIPHLFKPVYEQRKTKGLTIEKAKELVKEPAFAAAALVAMGYADAFISGATHPTADTIRAGLYTFGTRHYASSSMLILPKHHRPLLFADCGFNISPDAEQLANIAVSTADTALFLGINPRIAFLSFSTKGSGGNNLFVEKVRKAADLVKHALPDLPVEGEMQVDAALIPAIAKRKMQHSKLHGDATILIFPDLNAGNIGYKLVERLGGARAVGPIMQGFKKPFCDLSRGCSPDDIVDAIAITAVQCTANDQWEARYHQKQLDRK
ncbi:phosphotransacetylase [Candidatus Woesearchaeota archaeon]|nr:MAG: phosphotransacetylase [Candidatus Woesearchaeota archaeon]